MKKPIRILARVLLRIVFLAIFLCNYFVLCLYTYLSFYLTYDFGQEIQQPVWLRVGLVVLLPTILLLAVVLYWPEKKKRTAIPSRRPIYRRVFTIVSVAFFLFLVIDAREPEYRYSLNDITTKDPRFQTSTELLSTLYQARSDIPDLKYIQEADGYAAIEQHQDEIQNAWNQIRGLRDIVEKLASHGRLHHEHEIFDFVHRQIHVRRVALIYHCNSLLLARQGKVEKAIQDLCDFHKVSRKALEGAVDLIQKMIWVYISGENLRTAYQLAHEYPLGDELTGRLAEAFAPLTREEISLYKPWIGEYLSLLEQVDLPFFQVMRAKYYEPERRSYLYQVARFFPESLVDFLYRLTLQKNRTSQQICAFWEPVIEDSQENIESKGADDFEGIYTVLPLRNLGGWCFHQPPVFFAYAGRVVKVKVQSDLFASYLYSRLGKNAYVHSYFIDDRIRVVENRGKLVSAGKDRQFDTKDDISLEVYTE